MVGTGRDQVHLLIAITGDRGLCGGFNSSIARATRNLAQSLIAEGKTVKILTVGRKGRDQLKRDFSSLIVGSFEDIGKKGVAFAETDQIADRVLALFEEGAFDVCTVVYNRFQSAIAQIVTRQTLIPLPVPAVEEKMDASGAIYEFEPSEEAILADLLPRNLSVQLFRALLESNASEQGARMTAMDNATRNAGDMLNKLTVKYNRSRQAQITKELIEIISGAEAL
jgi:F-type H+-transporting ATPase subunit gamma